VGPLQIIQQEVEFAAGCNDDLADSLHQVCFTANGRRYGLPTCGVVLY
jgi:hypothetical protein